LSGRENFRLYAFIPIPTQPDFSGYFFLSYLRSKTLYIWAHGFLLYIKPKASLAICQGFLEKNRADTKDISSQDLIKAIDDLGKLAQSDKPQFSRVG